MFLFRHSITYPSNISSQYHQIGQELNIRKGNLYYIFSLISPQYSLYHMTNINNIDSKLSAALCTRSLPIFLSYVIVSPKKQQKAALSL